MLLFETGYVSLVMDADGLRPPKSWWGTGYTHLSTALPGLATQARLLDGKRKRKNGRNPVNVISPLNIYTQ